MPEIDGLNGQMDLKKLNPISFKIIFNNNVKRFKGAEHLPVSPAEM